MPGGLYKWFETPPMVLVTGVVLYHFGAFIVLTGSVFWCSLEFLVHYYYWWAIG